MNIPFSGQLRHRVAYDVYSAIETLIAKNLRTKIRSSMDKAGLHYPEMSLKNLIEDKIKDELHPNSA